MNFDLGCALFALLFVILGAVRGLIRQVFGVVGFVGGLVVARMFSAQVAEQVGPSLGLGKVAGTAVVSVAIFIAVEIVSSVIGNFLHNHLGAITGTVNRLGGAGVGLVKGLLVVWAVASLAALLHEHLPQAESKIPGLASLDLGHSNTVKAATGTNFLGDLEKSFGVFSNLPAPLRDAAIDGKRKLQKAVEAAGDEAAAAGKAALQKADEAQRAAQKAAIEKAKELQK
jgi:uncharacterized membrane protein required for colicin V production